MNLNNKYTVTMTPEILKVENSMWRKMTRVEAAVFETALLINSMGGGFSMKNISPKLKALLDIPNLETSVPIPIVLFLKVICNNNEKDFPYMINYLLTFAMLKKQAALEPEDIVPFDGQDWYVPTKDFVEYVAAFSRKQDIVLTDRTGWAAFFFAMLFGCDAENFKKMNKRLFPDLSMDEVNKYMLMMKTRCHTGFLIRPNGTVEETLQAMHNHPHLEYVKGELACNNDECPHCAGEQDEMSEELPDDMPEELKELIRKIQSEPGVETKVKVIKMNKGDTPPDDLPEGLKEAISEIIDNRKSGGACFVAGAGVGSNVGGPISSGETKGVKQVNTDHLSLAEYRAKVDDCATRLADITDELADIGCIASLTAFSTHHTIGLNVCNFSTDHPQYLKIIMQLVDLFMQYEYRRCTPEQMAELEIAFGKACED